MQTAAIIESQQLTPAELDFDFAGEALDMKLFPGEILSLTGPDYSGKSNWLKTLSGIENQATGKLRLLGLDVDRLSAKEWAFIRTKVSYIPHDSSLISAASALQNVTLAASYHQIDDDANLQQQAEQLLNELDPQLDIHELPAYLRKDQHYKIVIARALILKPAVLMLDNPFTFFDLKATAKLQQYLLQKVAKGLSIVQISHDIPYVLEHSSRFIFLHRQFQHGFTCRDDIINSDIPAVRDYFWQPPDKPGPGGNN